jgi:hypothetical protein
MSRRCLLGLAIVLACAFPALGSAANDVPQPAASSEPSAPPSPLPSSAPASASPAPTPVPVDRALSLLGDPWACETDHHAALVSAFSAPSEDRIDVRTTLAGGLAGNRHIDEAFVWDPVAATWHANVAGGAFVGSAPRWSGEVWIFTGTAATGGHTYNGRMVFTALGPNAFRRDFELERDGRRQIYSLETCSRDLSD